MITYAIVLKRMNCSKLPEYYVETTSANSLNDALAMITKGKPDSAYDGQLADAVTKWFNLHKGPVADLYNLINTIGLEVYLAHRIKNK